MAYAPFNEGSADPSAAGPNRQPPLTVGPPPNPGVPGFPQQGFVQQPHYGSQQPSVAPPISYQAPVAQYMPAPPAPPPQAPPSQQAAPAAPYDDDAPGPIPMKIVVSGGFGVGKTTFVTAISDIPPLTTEAAMTSVALGVDNRGDVGTKTTTTVAMDFGRVAVDQSLVLYMFGTPGQDRFGFMWDDLVTGALGAVILVDSRRLNDCFAALDYFESRQIPFVVAVNQFDGRLAHGLDDVRAALAVDQSVPVVSVDARSRDSVKWTILALLDVVLSRAVSSSRH